MGRKMAERRRSSRTWAGALARRPRLRVSFQVRAFSPKSLSAAADWKISLLVPAV